MKPELKKSHKSHYLVHQLITFMCYDKLSNLSLEIIECLFRAFKEI